MFTSFAYDYLHKKQYYRLNQLGLACCPHIYSLRREQVSGSLTALLARVKIGWSLGCGVLTRSLETLGFEYALKVLMSIAGFYPCHTKTQVQNQSTKI